ncbi:MAG: TonB-dependent receptor [Bacteroidales bacterium]|nr:TonB-dependent receptor [Bacteroidales bacterium]
MLSASDLYIKGKIIDCRSKEGLFLVNIGLLGTNKGTTTNELGEFTLTHIEQGEYILFASVIGFEERQIHLNIQSTSLEDIVIALCERAFDLEQVVVTGTRTERSLKNVPIQTQLITSKSIEKMQISNFKDLLEHELAGIEFTNNGGFANINMLGFGGKHVLFLIDGERMAGETFDNIDYNRVDMDNIQRIEIVKGASSSLYGSNALGGVINIISKKPEKKIEANAHFRAGSNNEQTYRASVGSLLNWGYVNFTTSLKSIDPYLLIDSEPVKQIFDNGSIRTLPLQETYIAGYKDYSFSPKIGIHLFNNTELEIRGAYFYKERNPGGLSGTKIADQYHSYTGGIKGKRKIDERQSFSVSLNFDKYDKLKMYKLLNEQEKNYENYQIRFGSVYNFDWEAGHSLVAGLDYFTDNLMTYMFVSDGSNAKKDAQTYSAFAQQEYVLNTKIVLVGGLRYDYHSQFAGHLSPRISAMFKPNPFVTIRGGYSAGFRSPTLKELFTNWFHPDGGGFQIIGNENMKAEKSNNYTLSTEISLGRSAITAMTQYSLINDMVNILWINNDTVVYDNIGDAKVLSTELTLNTRITDQIFLKGGYAFVYDNLGKNSVVRPHSVTMRIEHNMNMFKKYHSVISFSGKYFSKIHIYGIGDLDDSDIEIDNSTGEEYKIEYEAYAIFKLAVSQTLPFRFVLNVGVNNICNYKPKFASFYSSISPGRTFFVELKWRL